jgi:hypothetical protein
MSEMRECGWVRVRKKRDGLDIREGDERDGSDETDERSVEEAMLEPRIQ